MDWIKLIIVLVGVVAWIASNLKEAKQANVPVPPPLPPPDPNAPKQPKGADDLQDFLKQIRKRMGESEPTARNADEPMQAILVEEPRPKPTPPPPPLPAPPKPKKKKQEADKAPNLARRTAEVTSLIPEQLKPGDALKSELMSMSTSVRKPSRAAQEAARLLKSKDGLATAFVLREILGEPLSKRRRTR